jgi:hypothetical protein
MVAKQVDLDASTSCGAKSPNLSYTTTLRHRAWVQLEFAPPRSTRIAINVQGDLFAVPTERMHVDLPNTCLPGFAFRAVAPSVLQRGNRALNGPATAFGFHYRGVRKTSADILRRVTPSLVHHGAEGRSDSRNDGEQNSRTHDLSFPIGNSMLLGTRYGGKVLQDLLLILLAHVVQRGSCCCNLRNLSCIKLNQQGLGAVSPNAYCVVWILWPHRLMSWHNLIESTSNERIYMPINGLLYLCLPIAGYVGIELHDHLLQPIALRIRQCLSTWVVESVRLQLPNIRKLSVGI